MKDSELRARSKAFALRIINICDAIDSRKGRSVLINQVIRSSTSIGANLCEANYASSRADFICKLQISLKECAETEYWLDMLSGAGCIDDKTLDELLRDCGIIHRMLSKSIITAKNNKEQQS